MAEITKPGDRKIIDDFAKEIRERKNNTARPSTHVINFRIDRVTNTERAVELVPIDLLRYRKENGRIASDVLHYEYENGRLDEKSADAQQKIEKFLKKKDPEKTETLINNIEHNGQQEPAIITCDGFLINGNRRKMAIKSLNKKHPHKEKYKFMKVVILPGVDGAGGPPTLIEIEQLENRYQLQSEGKSEYYGFDRALSIKRKIKMGLSLKEQVKDDPAHTNKNEREINTAIREIEKEYLNPLKCVDKYLKQFGRVGHYHTVSTGMGDKEGRWQAFLDYSNTRETKFKNQNYLTESGIEEDEIGDLETAAFNIIRLRHVPGMPKVHKIMRDLHRYCSTTEGKKEILQIAEKVEPRLEDDEYYENGEPLPSKIIDAKWASKNQEIIIRHTKKSAKSYDNQKEKETPIQILEAALKKLHHNDMDLTLISIDKRERARNVLGKIKGRADDLKKELFDMEKKLKRWKKKKR